jgi:hypothetical protein
MKKNKYIFIAIIGVLLLLCLFKPIEGLTPQLPLKPIFNSSGVWKQPTLNFRGNDLGDSEGTRGTYASCKEDCQNTQGCIGMITDSLDGSSNGVHCLLKSNFSSPELEPGNFGLVYDGSTWSAPQVDFQGNDIQQYSDINLDDCKKKCQHGSTPCAGIITDFKESNARGNCWLKSKFETPIPRKNRYAHQYIWSTQ